MNEYDDSDLDDRDFLPDRKRIRVGPLLRVGLPLVTMGLLALGMLNLSRTARARTLAHEGAMSMKSGRVVDAIEPLEQAHKMRPRDDVLAGNLGMAYIGVGDVKKAEELFRGQLARGIETPRVWHGLGRSLLFQERYDEALRPLSKARHLDKEHARIAGDLGQALAATGHTEDALPLLRWAYEELPGDPQIRSALDQVAGRPMP